MIASSQNRIHI